MWGAPEEPPDGGEGAAGPSRSVQVREEAVGVKEICEDNRSQLETFKDIMMKNKSDLKRKEDKLQEYASKLSEIKSRAKLSRRSKDGVASSVETTPRSKEEIALPEDERTDDVGRAKTPKAKSSLLQRKLAENRKVFEKRSKEMTANKRAVEEKVEAIRQQMDQTDMTMVEAQKESLGVSPVRPVLVAQIVQPPMMQLGQFQDKDNKIAELSNRILELEATVIDLQDNLKEKDSVIESKTRAVTLMSADLSKKGKTTLDTLEETKDEMRTMQQNFVLIETSLKNKNDNLLEQLHERNDKVTELESTIDKFEREMEEKTLSDSAIASQSRTAMDTLTDTREAMKSMQENFVLIETSLKDKIENLLGQLENRETKLAEAEAKIYKLETGAGIEPNPEIPDLRYKIDRLEQSNRALQDEKYELQKNIVELQEKIVSREASNGNGLIMEKDNRIAELENLIEELKNSNQLLEEESKTELQKQVADLTATNEEFRCKIDDLEKMNNDYETRMNELRAKIPDDSATTKEDDVVEKLKKELEDLNKSMIKLKAQHKGKLRNLQKQLESFKMVSDANAELVKLGNQVALLEEEKGNLQLSLVDFDELKASAGDWQDRIADLESRVSTQTNDIQTHIEAIAILENQKLDLMQELHTVKQEISALEAENADSENLRVTAEMKVVDLEEQLESLNKSSNNADVPNETDTENDLQQLLTKIENLTHENSELRQKIVKLEEKPSSEAGSTESFETIHDDRNEMLKKIENLVSRNNELEEKLTKLEEGARSNVGSTESFETINDTEKTELLKKIETLSRDNSELVAKLNKFDEKGSSDTGSTESFEKISDTVDSPSKIELLTRENNELVIKLTKIGEKYDDLVVRSNETSFKTDDSKISELNEKLENLVAENNDLIIRLTKIEEKFSVVSEENKMLEKRLKDAETSKNATDVEISKFDDDANDLKTRIDLLTTENTELVIKIDKLEVKNIALNENLEKFVKLEFENEKIRENLATATTTVARLENEIEEYRKSIAEQSDLIDELKTKLSDNEAELERKNLSINDYEATALTVEQLQRELKDSLSTIDEWKTKYAEIERKMDILESEKISIEESFKILREENESLIKISRDKEISMETLKRDFDETMANYESRTNDERIFAEERDREIANFREIVRTKDEELREKYSSLQNQMIRIDELQDSLNDCEKRILLDETKMASMSEEIARLNGVVNESKEETISAQAEIIVLREELLSKSAKEAKNAEIAKFLDEKEIIVEETTTRLNEQLKENANLKNIVDNANVEIANLQKILAEKNDELTSLETAKIILEDNLREFANVRAEADNRMEFLQRNLNDSEKYTNDLKAELNDAYKMLELVKTKHTEDVEMQNRRLEDIIVDSNVKNSECELLRREFDEKINESEILRRELNEKINECEQIREELEKKMKLENEFETMKSQLNVARAELAEKNEMIGRNVTEDAKIALELKISELETKLEESEANNHSQLQKRKILAANLKKKSSEVAEHETRAQSFEKKSSELELKLTELEPKFVELTTRTSELEEKWLREKSEKESANLSLREMTTTIEDREKKIAQLEEQLMESRRETAKSIERVNELTSELRSSAEKMVSLMEQTTEMGEEVERLRMEIDEKSTTMENERREKERIIVDYEERRKIMENEEIRMQQVLAESKEKARELGVRMQVMETEYVQQLNAIQTLRTENGMLVSKQAQISEKLENAEKEAAETKIILDSLQREMENFERPSIANDDVAERVEKSTTTETTNCDHCDQCQTVVQALEAKLQERDAEIENLDNELANSIGNFVHMRESLRVSDLMNQSNSRNRNLDDVRDNNDLAIQYQSSNNEIREQLNATILENQDLNEKISSLQALNAALEERINSIERELIEGREETTRLQSVDATHAELLKKFETRENELTNTQRDFEIAKKQHEDWTTATKLRLENYEAENERLKNECDDLRRSNDVSNDKIVSLTTEIDRRERTILDLEKKIVEYGDKSSKDGGETIAESIASASVFFDDAKDDPQLFDAAKLFGPPVISNSSGHREISDLRDTLATRETENSRLADEARRLNERIVEEQSSHQRTNENCRRLENELTRLEDLLAERNAQIAALNSELNNVGVQLAGQFDNRQTTESLNSEILFLRTQLDLQSKNHDDIKRLYENLSSANIELSARLENLERQNISYSTVIDVLSSNLKNFDDNVDDEISFAIDERTREIFDVLTVVKRERRELLAAQENLRERIATLEREGESLSDVARIQELEELVNGITRERDIKQLQVNDLTRSLEEMQETMENSSSREENRLRNLQASLDEAQNEHERLKIELETAKKERETVEFEKSAKTTIDANPAKSSETTENRDSEIFAEKYISDEVTNVEDTIEIEEIDPWTEEWPTSDDRRCDSTDRTREISEEIPIVTNLRPSVEITLRTRIAELEDRIKDLEIERNEMVENAKISTARMEKMIKKLKAFKIQNENLKRQLNIQKASTGFGDLDTAIEDELKSQIAKLEKSADEAKDERKKLLTERENLSKRIEVLSSANERLVEMKERQDLEVEVLQMRTKDLTNKLRAVEWQFKESCDDEKTTEFTVAEDTTDFRRTENSAVGPNVQNPSIATLPIDCLCKKYRQDLDELRDEMEALAAENEQLQQLLEEQKHARQTHDTKHAEETSLRDKNHEKSTERIRELEKHSKTCRDEFENLQRAFEKLRKDSNDEISTIQRNNEMLRIEIAEKTNEFDTQSGIMRREIEAATIRVNNLNDELSTIVREKNELAEKLSSHEETKENYARLTDSMAEVTELLNSRVQEVAELKREMQKLKMDSNEALAHVETVAHDHERESSMRQQQSLDYLRLCESRLTERSEESSALREKLSEMEISQTRLTTELNEINRENSELREKLTETNNERASDSVRLQNLRDEIDRLNVALTETKSHRESLQSELAGKEQEAFKNDDELRKYAMEIDRLNDVVSHAQKSSFEIAEEANRKIREIEERETSLRNTLSELTSRESEALAQLYSEINDKDGKLAILQQTVFNLEEKIREVGSNNRGRENIVEKVEIADVTSVDVNDETRETVERLRQELNRRNEEIEDYKYQLSENTYPSIIQSLQDQINDLYEEKLRLEQSLSSLMEKFTLEKRRCEELTNILNEKDVRLSENNRDIENLRKLLTETGNEKNWAAILAAKETEIKNLKVEIEDKGIRFRELHDHYESAEMEINEMRMHLASKNEEIRLLTIKLEAASEKSATTEQNLKKEILELGENSRIGENSGNFLDEAAKEQSSNELDFALYMLHQRDVRVEELTHELMQLLEERDTLQLRLSNAIRINEELRRSVVGEISTSSETIGDETNVEPLIEHPSPSKSVGPVEIAKEAIDSPNEDKAALAQNYEILLSNLKSIEFEDPSWFSAKLLDLNYPKGLDALIAAGKKLSQLRNMGHRRDVRLMDDRESRHNQQMSLLTHRDVLSTLPPEAAARLVNANYTLSRDVQSQSSVLMNWLWGKSTPKVVHM